MFRRSTFAIVLWVLAAALLPIRMANAHLHLCLDGQEPPVTVHVFDVPTLEHADHDTDGHQDRDVQVSKSIGKVAGLDDAGVALLGAYVLAALLPVQSHLAPAEPDLVPSHDSPLALRPPSRGPPV